MLYLLTGKAYLKNVFTFDILVVSSFYHICAISSSLFFTGQNFWGGWFNNSDRGKVRRRGGFCKYPQC